MAPRARDLTCPHCGSMNVHQVSRKGLETIAHRHGFQVLPFDAPAYWVCSSCGQGGALLLDTVPARPGRGVRGPRRGGTRRPGGRRGSR